MFFTQHTITNVVGIATISPFCTRTDGMAAVLSKDVYEKCTHDPGTKIVYPRVFRRQLFLFSKSILSRVYSTGPTFSFSINVFLSYPASKQTLYKISLKFELVQSYSVVLTCSNCAPAALTPSPPPHPQSSLEPDQTYIYIPVSICFLTRIPNLKEDS